jgi:hypothetical protein
MLTAFVLRFAEAQPVRWFSSHTVASLFGSANLAFLSCTLLLLIRVVRAPATGAAGISNHAQRLNLLAHGARATFTLAQNGPFGRHVLSWADASLSLLSTAALILALHPKVASWLAGKPARGAMPETFPSALVAAGIALLAGLFYAELRWREGSDAPEATSWLLLAAAIYMQAAAMLPQRALLLRTRRLPALTWVAFVFLALGCVLRLCLWCVLMLEGEFHFALMAGDFIHIALQADFMVLCARALRQQGVAAVLEGSMHLGGGDEEV